MPLKVEGVDVLHRPVKCPETSDSRYDGPHPSTTILPKGFKKSPNAAPFRATTIFTKDIEITLRDGTKIRADVFRPHDSVEGVPALIAWSPYGKSGRGTILTSILLVYLLISSTGHFNLDIIPERVGVPEERLSGFEKFEAPDPAEWTARGYAIVNVDARGVYDSEGDIR